VDSFDLGFLKYQASCDIAHYVYKEGTATDVSPVDMDFLFCDYRQLPLIFEPRFQDQKSRSPPLPDPSSVLVVMRISEKGAQPAPYGFIDRSIISNALAGGVVHRKEGDRLVQMKGKLTFE